MKILYLDINVIYHNPTRNSIPYLLKNISELYIYGLGYTSDHLLQKGLNHFYEINGPFDFVVTNEHIVFGSQNLNKNNDLRGYENNYFTQFDLGKVKKTVNEQFDFFKSYKETKLVFLLETDYYNLRKRNIDLLHNLSNLFVISWGEDMVLHTEVLQDLSKESFGKHSNNNWYDFVQNNNKIIQMPHFVNSNEFYFECLDNRKNIVYVTGVNYYHRKKVLEILKNSQYKIDNKKYYNKLYSLMRKLKVKPDSHPILMRLYNILFRNELEYSKYVFTCGSGLEWPIRKFFEIPALGSLLLAKPFCNADKFGFIDGVNYIKTDYSDIEEKITWLEANPQIAQEIAKKGQDMIWKSHSLSARAEQVKQSLEVILADKFNGTYWKNGEFYVK